MRAILIALGLMAAGAQAEVPAVLTDIAPVQSLTAQVMGDLGTPELLLDPQTDPHHFQLRPSQARLMASADLVIWMGPAMTPWLPRVIDALGDAVTSVGLLDLPALPAPIANDGVVDPHAWLDPDNAQAYLAAIATALAVADPENAATYRANASAAVARLETLTSDLAAQLSRVRNVTLVPYHDAYRYFFRRFDLKSPGALAPSDAAPPSAARIARLRDLLAATPRHCVFSEPGANPALIRTIAPVAAQTAPQLDALGAHLTPGPRLYDALMRDLAKAIATCEIP